MSNDLISRKELIQSANEWWKNNNAGAFSAHYLFEFRKIINQQPAAYDVDKLVDRWIPVRERLPDEELEQEIKTRGKAAVYPVLATVRKRRFSGECCNVTDKVFYGSLDGNKTFFDKDANKIHVIAWQQLPEQYKEGEE